MKSPPPVIEILPQKSRALLMMICVCAIFAFAYFLIFRQFLPTGQSAVTEPLGSTGSHQGLDLNLIIYLFVLVFAINAFFWIRSLLPNPTPRVRITSDRLDLIGFWRTKGFAWRDFGFFEVKKVSRGKSGKAVMIRAMAPGSEPTGGFVNWLGLSRGMLEFDIGPFVPLFRKSVDEGEKIANWILALRDGRDVPPPDTLIVRTTTASMSAVAKNQTVVRR